VPTLDRAGDPTWVDIRRGIPSPSKVRLPAPLTDANPRGDPVVTPAQASRILAATWSLRARALAPVDPHLFSAFEDGPALEEDSGRCRCDVANPFGVLGVHQVVVARQTTYPAQFMAQVSTTASGQFWVATLVFVRTSSAHPWKLRLVTGLIPDGPVDLLAPDTDADGFAIVSRPTTDVDLSSLHQRLAEYWQAWKDDGRAPESSFADGAWTTQWGRKLTEQPQGSVRTDVHFTGHYLYAADPRRDGTYVFNVGQGRRLVCGVVRVQKTWTGSAERPRLVQDLRRRPLGISIPPGTYRAYLSSGITEPCILVPPDGQHLVVRAAYEYFSADAAFR
jgi:hypothetical protein